MTIIYRVEKGAPLSAADLDGNFHNLESRIKKIEQGDIAYPQLNFSIVGSVLTIKDAQDQILAESVIPVLRFTPKGAWKPQVHYIFNDIICIGPKVWCALKSHTSQPNFNDDQSLWMLFADLTPR